MQVIRIMNICGLQKTTLLDYPGRVAATVFTGGCNFRCPFCHNSQLLKAPLTAAYSSEETLAFLTKRKGVLEGVCITGGEPTLCYDLEDFLTEIQALGLAVKLDTNGYNPNVLKRLCDRGLVNYVAMDIKASKENYGKAAGVPKLRIESINESVEFLLSGSVPYEFRTTVVRGLHTSQDFDGIGPWIKGCSEYYLQCFAETGHILAPGLYSAFTKDEMLGFAKQVSPFVGKVVLRGIEY